MQVLTMHGFVVVATPQNLAALDAKRSINMIRKLNVEVLGVVENYTGEIFGSGAGKQLAKDLELPFLGEVQLRAVYKDMDIPPVLGDQEIEEEYNSIWRSLEEQLQKLEFMPDQIQE